jgi:3-oxoacyl-[acyl-carrier-protein] synthase-1
MVYKIADNIVSPIGWTTEQNYDAIKSGCSSLRNYQNYEGIPEDITASLFCDSQHAEMHIDGLTRFESMVVHSVRGAMESSAIDLAGKRVVFILSTTKGNIELLADHPDAEEEYPGVCAGRIVKALGLKVTPVVVCNACISGLSAIILASRLLECDDYDYAVVCGADCQGQFIISGFQSFKALSAEDCKPFDIERTGLNLGEAAATIILGKKKEKDDCWGIEPGCVRNDAFHISAPSKKGDGAYLALSTILAEKDISLLAVINAHGTATLFNDQMESLAIDRAGLSGIPVNSLKGYFGHTMGAAGILETLLTMKAVDDHCILATRGYAELGVSGNIHPTAESLYTDKTDFIKMLSGFGGCNAAIWCTHDDSRKAVPTPRKMKSVHRVTVSPESVVVDGVPMNTESRGKQLLSYIYKHCIDDYPKFYKMDMLSRLGFVASELLLNAEGRHALDCESERAIVLFNRTSSLDTDKLYLDSIIRPDDYYPSPSLFVYTLPNIVTGEIAIRNGYKGETSFYVLAERNEEVMNEILEATTCDHTIKSMITGWLDYVNEEDFLADFVLHVIED